MAENDKELELDSLLDSLLSSYAAAEPRPGFQLRIHASLRSQQRRQRWTWNLAFAGAVAATIVTALLVLTRAELHTHDYGTPAQTRPTAGSEPVHVPAGAVQATKIRPAAAPRHARAQSKTAALLQLASALHNPDALIFEQEKSYVAPAQKQQQTVEPAQAPGNTISIQNLGVDSIEIKGLAPDKGDDKGNL